MPSLFARMQAFDCGYKHRKEDKEGNEAEKQNSRSTLGDSCISDFGLHS